MRFLIVALTCIVLVLVSGCAEGKASNKTTESFASASDIEFLNSLDFSQALDDATYVTLMDLENPECNVAYTTLLESFASFVPQAASNAGLSDLELKRIAICTSPSGNRTSTFLDMLGSIERFYDTNGRFPDSSGEILYSIIGSNRMSQFATSGIEERLEWCLPFVNPVTGGVVETFDKEGWRPGGVWLERIVDPSEIESRVGSITLIPVDAEGNTIRPRELWLVTIYGERPGSEILRFPWWRK